MSGSSRPPPSSRRAQRRRHTDVDAVPLAAFGLAADLDPGWSLPHTHDKHQLLYAASGSLELVMDGGRWLLPPERAAWIGAGVTHAARARSAASLRAVYFDRSLPLLPGAACAVFAVTALAREMILYAMRWGPDRVHAEPDEQAFFVALGALAVTWSSEPLPLRLPLAKSPELERAMERIFETMAEAPTIEAVARHAGLSPRTLARRFESEAQTSFRAFLQRARMVRATELLAREGARVTEVALDVGFESPAAFTRAFAAFLGERPRDYRKKQR